MGCDIHEYYQVRDPDTGLWSFVDGPRIRRNYEAFAVLAGVRNYHGRTPWSEPRGLPEGFAFPPSRSDEDFSDAEFYECDGHSASHFTLAEMESHADRTPKYAVRHGLVSERDWRRWLFSREAPKAWCSGSSSEISVEEMMTRVGAPKPVLAEPSGYTPFGDCAWLTWVSYEGGHLVLLNDVIPAMRKLIPDGGVSDDVRLVFFFDN